MYIFMTCGSFLQIPGHIARTFFFFLIIYHESLRAA